MIIHADDYGISLNQSKKILACSSVCGGEGALNSTSVVVTSPVFTECSELIKPHVIAGHIKLGLHLNIVEGQALSKQFDIPLLADANGMFKQGFAGALALSLRNHDKLMRQVRIEAYAQIEAFLTEFPELRSALRIDSHQHFHMIPAVFEGLLAAAEDSNARIEYLRIPAEPLVPFMQIPDIRRNIPPVNVAKNVLLNSLWRVNKKHYPLSLSQPALFFGLALSGCMQHVVHNDFLQRANELAAPESKDIELLFHPGGISDADECLNPDLKGFVNFYASQNRAKEAEALCALTQYLLA